MKSLPIVEDLDVLEDGAASLLARREVLIVHEFNFQRREETLGDGKSGSNPTSTARKVGTGVATVSSR